MLVQWYADIDGDESKVLPRVTEIMHEVSKQNNVKVLGGPYRPQANSVLFLAEYTDSNSFQKVGKIFLERAMREGLAITPARYEIAFGVGEAGGP
jgi:hypothetical protein